MMQLVNNFSSYTEETPIDKTPNNKTPNDKTPNDKTPNDKTSIDKTPIDKTPIIKTPSDKTPNDKTPNDKTPIDKTPIDKTNKETFATKCLLTFYAIQKMFWKYCICTFLGLLLQLKQFLGSLLHKFYNKNN